MNQKKFHINSYDLQGNEKLGFTCAIGSIYEFELPDEVRTYSFKVELKFNKDCFHYLMGKSVPTELITGVYNGNLKDFEYTYKLSEDFRDEDNDSGERTGFDWFKFLETNFPDHLKFAEERLIRKKKNKVPEIVIYKEGGTGFRENGEFLEFDESACNWAGPFKLEDKKGCVMFYGKNKHKKEFPIFNVKTQHSFYDLPYSTQKKLELSDCKTANDHWRLTPEQKEILFNSLSCREQCETAQNYFRSVNAYLNETLLNTQPFRIYLAGNDDCSYTKWFSSAKELNDELKFLRVMQPLNFSLDITERGYIFTN